MAAISETNGSFAGTVWKLLLADPARKLTRPSAADICSSVRLSTNDNIYGAGTGEFFFMGAFLDALPTRVHQLIGGGRH